MVEFPITIVEFGIIIIIIITVYKYIERRTYDVVYVTSPLNDRAYLVRNLPDKAAAADLLASLSGKLESLVTHISRTPLGVIYDKHISPDLEAELYANTASAPQSSDADHIIETVRATLKDDLARLRTNFNPDNFSENTPDSQHTSYSANKGEKIVFCLRDRNHGESLVDENVMMFVAIHELAHLMTKSVGHGPDFWANFKVLLKIAIAHGVYTYINFNKQNTPYCGITITDTPLKLTTTHNT